MARPKDLRGGKSHSVMKKKRTVEYPELKGKIIEQVRYSSDPDFTVLVIEFNDNTRATFRLRADVSFALEPEISSTDAVGDIANWKILKKRSLPPTFKRQENGNELMQIRGAKSQKRASRGALVRLKRSTQ